MRKLLQLSQKSHVICSSHTLMVIGCWPVPRNQALSCYTGAMKTAFYKVGSFIVCNHLRSKTEMMRLLLLCHVLDNNAISFRQSDLSVSADMLIAHQTQCYHAREGRDDTGNFVTLGKASMSQYHYSNPSTSFMSSGLGMAEEIYTCLCGPVRSKSLCSIQSSQNQTGPRFINKNLFIVRAIGFHDSFLQDLYKHKEGNLVPSWLTLRNSSRREKVGIEMLCHGLISERISPVPWEKDGNPFIFTFSLAEQ